MSLFPFSFFSLSLSFSFLFLTLLTVSEIKIRLQKGVSSQANWSLTSGLCPISRSNFILHDAWMAGCKYDFRMAKFQIKKEKQVPMSHLEGRSGGSQLILIFFSFFCFSSYFFYFFFVFVPVHHA